MIRSKKLQPLTVVLSILCSVSLFSGLPYLCLRNHRTKTEIKKMNGNYNIRTIVQKGPVKEALKTVHLCELLQLSRDHPSNLISFDLRRGEELLLSSGVISSAHLSKKMPDCLEVDYSIREPVAFLADYSNTVLDENGVIFSLQPYLTPKILPKLYLGIQIEPFVFGRIKDKKMKVALKVLKLLSQFNQNKSIFLDQIDVSNITASSMGQQEIVVSFFETLGEESYIRYLRLSKDNYEEEFLHFLNLKAMNLPKNLVVDMRLFPNAYLTTLEVK